jgi:hypothetical protein
MFRVSFVISFLLIVHQLYAQQLFSSNPEFTVIHTEDVNQFWEVFDKASSLKTKFLETEYLQKGGDGLKAFIPNRIESGKNLSKVVKQSRECYESICESSLSINT